MSAHGSDRARSPAEKLKWGAIVGAFAVLPVAVYALAVRSWLADDTLGIDFLPLRTAAKDIFSGRSPWPSTTELAGLLELGSAYVYPPLAALVVAPLALVPATAATLVWTGLLIVATFVALNFLGVRDWRCYGAAFLWGCVVSAVQTGNVTLLLVAGLAALWRFRRNAAISALLAGFLIALKFFLWPLLVWLAATRRYGSALGGLAAAGLITIASWATTGFSGLRAYPELLRTLHEIEESRSYTVLALSLDLGLPREAAWAANMLVAGALLGGAVLLAGRRDEARALGLTIAAAIAFSTVVWLHYFALLLVPVALTRPRFGVIWLVPLAFWLGSGTGNGAPWQTGAVLVVAAGTLALALRRPSRADRRTRDELAAARPCRSHGLPLVGRRPGPTGGRAARSGDA